jgi:two-component system, chemotaxis family, sensor kinase CheA
LEAVLRASTFYFNLFYFEHHRWEREMSELPKEVLDEYLGETREMLERLSMNLGLVEKKTHNDETLNSIYRDMHSIKGSSYLFGFRHIGELAHAMETALDPIRHKLVSVSSPMMDALYGGLDLIGKMTDGISENGAEGEHITSGLSKLIPLLADLTVSSLGGDLRASNDSVGAHDSILNRNPSVTVTATAEILGKQNMQTPPTHPTPTPSITATLAQPAAQKTPATTAATTAPAAAPQPSKKLEFTPASVQAAKPLTGATAAPAMTASASSSTPSAAGPSSGGAGASVGGSGGGSGGSGHDSGGRKPADDGAAKDDHGGDTSTIRIQVSLLDNLMNLVGELVLVRNQVLQFTDRNADQDFQKLSQRLNIVTSELQNDVMKTRMQPVGTILTKFHRVVRDMSRDLGKKIELKLEGVETELDKTLVEAVKDPLTHLVRNSVDHGLEKPEERRMSGKTETGTVLIRSYHEGGQVIIEIKDDGRGLSRDKIGKKAVEKGILTEEQLARMPEREVQALIFAPGFSTAEKVTNISGRGVGMDVVKTNIERIGGAIDLSSTVNHGTSIRLKIPLTLAIIPALVIKVMGTRFAIAQVKVVELVRVEREKKGSGRIELLQGRPVYRLRGQLLPLVDLCATLGIKADSPDELVLKPINNIVVLNSESGMFGLIVDEVVDNADIVVKPLSKMLKNLATYSGATIMGDGAVVLILDVPGLALAAHLSAGSEETRGATRDLATDKSLSDAAEYLFVDLGVPGHYAIPLCLVNRLEEFEPKLVEVSGAQRVVRYRDSLLPLIQISKHLDLPGSGSDLKTSEDRVSIVVISKLNRLFGLEVKNIVDIVQINSTIDSNLSDRPGIHGSLIHGSEVIVVLDAHKIIDDSVKKISGGSALPQTAFKLRDTKALVTAVAKSDSDARSMRSKLKILLTEDTAFFRRHVKTFLEEAGFVVVTAVNGEEGFKIIEESRPNEYAMVVTDIEMPILDGFELVKKLRALEKTANLPVIALTTRVRKVDIDRGAEVGFNAYLEKFNGEILVQNMDQMFGITK